MNTLISLLKATRVITRSSAADGTTRNELIDQLCQSRGAQYRKLASYRNLNK